MLTIFSAVESVINKSIKRIKYIRSEVFTTLKMWIVMSCSRVGSYQHFEETTFTTTQFKIQKTILHLKGMLESEGTGSKHELDSVPTYATSCHSLILKRNSDKDWLP
jgi:hypothetical protein